MITEARLRQAHGAFVAGMPLKDLARAYGVNYTELSKALKAWRARNGLATARPASMKQLNRAAQKLLKRGGGYGKVPW